MKAKQMAMRAAMLILALCTLPSMAAQPAESEILRRFELMKPDKCNKPKAKSLPLPATSFFDERDTSTNEGWRERFFSDLDGDGTCEIIDIWIDRLTPLPNDNRLMHFSEIHQYKKGRWVYAYGSGKDFSPFDYVPKYQLRDKSTGRIYYLFDFDFNSGTGLWIHAHGTKYFDRWPTQKEINARRSGEKPYGIMDCGYSGYEKYSGPMKDNPHFMCDGLALGEVVEVLLKQKAVTQP